MAQKVPKEDAECIGMAMPAHATGAVGTYNASMWQRFTERARKVVFYAQEEAQRYREGYVSTEHLLLGICREEDTSAARILSLFGVDLFQLRAEVEKQMSEPGPSRPSSDMTLTPRAKHVIDLAYDEARGLDHNYIGTEHLLLGLVREAKGLAGRVLSKLGVDLEQTRAFTLEVQDAARTGRSADASRVTQRTPQAYNPEINRAASLMHGLLGKAWTIAEATGENVVRSEHILRALAEENTGLAAEILAKYGLTTTVIDEEIVRRKV
jgi:ATP-dependent Clp protease ATP-binding subunit ClpA